MPPKTKAMTEDELAELEERILHGSDTYVPLPATLPKARLGGPSFFQRHNRLSAVSEISSRSNTSRRRSSVTHWPPQGPQSPVGGQLHANASATKIGPPRFLQKQGSLTRLSPKAFIPTGKLLWTKAFTKVKELGRRPSEETVVARAHDLVDEMAHMSHSFRVKLAMTKSQSVLAISFESPFKLWWDALQTLAALYAILIAPMDVAFDWCAAYPAAHTAQLVVETAFLVDVLLHFHTTFVDPASLEEVVELPRLRRHYFVGRFGLDVVCSIPVTYFGVSPYAKLLRFGVLVRARRLVSSPVLKRIMTWVARQVNVGFVRLVAVALFYLVIHHYIACGYYMVTAYEATHFAHAVDQSSLTADPVNDMLSTTTSEPTEVELWEIPFRQDDALEVKYIGSLFQAITVTGGFTLYPRTTPERLFSGLMFIVGAATNACVFGVCATLLKQIYQVDDERIERSERLHASLGHCHVPIEVQKRIFEYYDSVQGVEDAHQASDLFASIPDKLHLELELSMHEEFLRKVPLFQALSPEGILALLQCMENVVALTGDVIISAGEKGQAFYLIQSGTVEVFHESRDGPVVLKDLGSGEFFGEMSLIMENARTTANVVATSFCKLQVIYKDMFLLLTTQNKPLKEFLTRARAKRLELSKAGKRVQRAHGTLGARQDLGTRACDARHEPQPAAPQTHARPLAPAASQFERLVVCVEHEARSPPAAAQQRHGRPTEQPRRPPQQQRHEWRQQQPESTEHGASRVRRQGRENEPRRGGGAAQLWLEAVDDVARDAVHQPDVARQDEKHGRGAADRLTEPRNAKQRKQPERQEHESVQMTAEELMLDDWQVWTNEIP
ncbi:Aste57867_21398 [Aphanomyces stellatus]|uniref:Aste57867_21398 protein n=1 Tax=Aphanomyces stellatus TaxID=120398 RepID=A0A485LIP7_9STRA|nr:hypothetical protein As57867_021329 [Aphanomyces stellatus]VFT98069.1 Aste57867_21398 [Aphanomyces stellatus]